jgi:hypothetical protein
MSLPADERRKLRRMERAETRADPGLAARFYIFGQLSRHDDMPRNERLKAREVRRRKWSERMIIEYFILGRDALLRGACAIWYAAPFRRLDTSVCG